MRHTYIILSALVAMTTLTACTEPDGSPGKGIEHGGALSKTDVGVAAGVVTGGLAGSLIGGGTGNTLAIIGGGLLGGVLGDEIGNSLDRADQAAYERASQNAMESGQIHSWRNPESGHHGSIVPGKEFANDDDDNCREYTQTIYIDGERHKAHGTACRDEDGTWRAVE